MAYVGAHGPHGRLDLGRNLHLLQRLHGLGLPVPAAVAAYYARRAGVYRAAIIVARLPDVRPLASLLDGRAEPGLWPALGRTLARFHAAGVDHADLNANNILIDSRGQIFLIDFDRGAIRNKLGAWRARSRR
jgi:3-deoxy-D-manno-octulosonic acid kinase